MSADVEQQKTCFTCSKPLEDCQCSTVKVSAEDQQELQARIENQAAQYRTAQQADIVEGRYKLIEKIGVGGMGTVYRAQHVVLHRQVALKILRTELLSDQNAMARFEQEARACAALSHVNLVAVYDCGVTERSQPYLVMEFLNGQNLLEIIKESGALSLNLFLDIFIEVCKGLSYAHANGVIHRDLKPSNIIITEDPRGGMIPKVVDFGVAKIEDLGGEFQMLTRTGEVFGSPAYMSPEQCQGHTVDQRSDIYALGCVMYEALSGKQAFKGANIMTIMTKQMEDYPSRPEQLQSGLKAPTQLVDAIMICLNKDAKNRYQTIDDLRRELEQVRDNLLASRIIEIGRFKISSERLTAGLIVLASIMCLALYPVLLQRGDFGAFKGDSKSSSPLTTAMLGAWSASRDMPRNADRYFDSVIKSEELGVVDRLAVSLMVLEGWYGDNKYDEISKFYGKTVEPLLKELDQIIAKDPESARAAAGFAPLIYYYVGGALERQKFISGAEHKYSDGIKLSRKLDSPEWVQGRLYDELGELLFDNNQYPKALPVLKKALDLYFSDNVKNELEGDIYDSTKRLAKILDKNKDYDTAIIVLSRTVKYEQSRQPVNKDHTRSLIEMLIKHCGKANRNDEAEKWRAAYLDLSKDKSKDAKEPAGDVKIGSAPYAVLIDRAVWMKNQHRFSVQPFEDAIEKAIADKASDLEVCSVSSIAFRELAERAMADDMEKLFSKILPALNRLKLRAETKDASGKPGYAGSVPLIYLQMAQAEYNAKRYSDAEGYVNTGLQLSEGQPDGIWIKGQLHRLLAQCLIEDQKYEEAKKAALVALNELGSVVGKKNAEIAECYYIYAKACDRSGDYKAAKNAVDTAIAIVQPLGWDNWRANSYYYPLQYEISEHEKGKKQ